MERAARFLLVSMIVAAAGCGDDGGSADDGGTDGAGGDTGTDSGGPPMVVSTVPEDGDVNVRLLSPIVITFSAPLDPSTVDIAGVTLETDEGDDVPRTVTLSPDGMTVTVQITTPPVLDSELTATVKPSMAGVDGSPVPETPFSWTAPYWWRTPAVEDAGEVAVGVAGDGRAYLAYVAGRAAARTLAVVTLDNDSFMPVGGALGEAGNVLFPRIAVDGSMRPIVAWVRASAGSPSGPLLVSRFEGGAWVSIQGGVGMGDTIDTSDGAPALAVDSAGRVLIAYPRDGDLHVRRIDGTTATEIGPALGPPNDDWAFTAGASPVVAQVQAPSQILVHRFDGSAWQLDASLAREGTVSNVEIASTADAPIVAWREMPPSAGSVDDARGHQGLYVTRVGSGLGTAAFLGPSVALGGDIESLALAVGAMDRPLVAWVERMTDADRRLYVARHDGTRFEALGGSIGGSLSTPAAVAIGRGPVVAIALGGGAGPGAISAALSNGSPSAPFGLRRPFPSAGGCRIPEDGDPTFPMTVADTGCYADVATRTVVPGAIAYDLNAALWSDGAIKRRFIVLPAGGTIGLTAMGAWTIPVGTIIIKEFLLERTPGDRSTIFPMETRFLVKRCEDDEAMPSCAQPWQGYSYRWDMAGTTATLMTNEAASMTFDWPLSTGTMHTHSYPGRTECVRCHNVNAGRVLGLQTGQFNRNLDYGNGVVDNQLRAMAHVGAFGAGSASVDPGTAFRLPIPEDATYSMYERVRAYLHANCSHCHRSPTTEAGARTLFTWEAPLEAAGNICNRLVPGDAMASYIYDKDSTRPPAIPMFGGSPMPPLATLIRDEAHLVRLAAWINSLTSCP